MNSVFKANRSCLDDSNSSGILLIVDDNPLICRMLSRRLLSSFDALHTACTKEEAEQHLSKTPVSHLVCDKDLGESAQNGIALVARWRTEYPSIERAVLFTGDESTGSATLFPGIDAVVYKTTNFNQLIKSLKR
ncbi:MAG: response regulator [Deltaproteobacteria bacterium]|nr:response regulator [Deltaproteobacteria bacterium]